MFSGEDFDLESIEPPHFNFDAVGAIRRRVRVGISERTQEVSQRRTVIKFDCPFVHDGCVRGAA